LLAARPGSIADARTRDIAAFFGAMRSAGWAVLWDEFDRQPNATLPSQIRLQEVRFGLSRWIAVDCNGM
jgi:hypothetical protein